ASQKKQHARTFVPKAPGGPARHGVAGRLTGAEDAGHLGHGREHIGLLAARIPARRDEDVHLAGPARRTPRPLQLVDDRTHPRGHLSRAVRRQINPHLQASRSAYFSGSTSSSSAAASTTLAARSTAP